VLEQRKPLTLVHVEDATEANNETASFGVSFAWPDTTYPLLGFRSAASYRQSDELQKSEFLESFNHLCLEVLGL